MLNGMMCCLLIGPLMVTGATNVAAQEDEPSYTAKPTKETPRLTEEWDAPVWKQANTLQITRPLETLPGSDHKPKTEVRILYDEKGLHLHFRVQDQYVRCVEVNYSGLVWEDSAVEFFVQPKEGRGYFNFEINCGGTLLLGYKENPDFKGTTLKKSGRLPWKLASRVVIAHTMPHVIDPEITEPVEWRIQCFIPYEIFETYLGPLGDPAGQTWRANFYKIAETNSHPHYIMWSPILEGNTFHAPKFFGALTFAE